jgi:hypothetical protein
MIRPRSDTHQGPDLYSSGSVWTIYQACWDILTKNVWNYIGQNPKIYSKSVRTGLSPRAKRFSSFRFSYVLGGAILHSESVAHITLCHGLLLT